MIMHAIAGDGFLTVAFMKRPARFTGDTKLPRTITV